MQPNLKSGGRIRDELVHVNVWQKPLQYCKAISLQLNKLILKKRDELVSLSNLIDKEFKL